MNSKIHLVRGRALPMSACVAIATSWAGGAAQAQDSTLKSGVTFYQTHARSTGITGIGVPAGAEARVGNATTWIFVYEYQFAPNIGAELVIGVPPKIKAYGSGNVAFLGEVVEARNVAPTLLFNYHFGQPGDTLRPYAGVGINYTKFTDASSPYGYDVSLSDSWGPAAQVGLDYAFNAQWGVYGSIAVVKVKSDLVAIGATVLKTTIDFRPVVYSFGVSYKF
jgi:outer membrane protein